MEGSAPAVFDEKSSLSQGLLLEVQLPSFSCEDAALQTSFIEEKEATRFFSLRGGLWHSEKFTPLAECCWSLKSRELLAYNAEFLRLIEIPEHLLQSGFQWGDLGLYSSDRLAATETRRKISEEHGVLMSGLSAQTRFWFQHIPASQRAKRIEVFATVVSEELRWICLERSMVIGAPVTPPEATQRKRSSSPFTSHLQSFVWKIAALSSSAPPKKLRPTTANGELEPGSIERVS